MSKRNILAGLLAICFLTSHAQDTLPLLQGKIDVSITRGTIECNFKLLNIPNIDDYYIRLNSGMNIRYIKNPEGRRSLTYSKSLNDTLATGEANAYFIDGRNDYHKYLPAAIQLSYVGMFPVISDTTSAEDWKGNIAFNGKSLRTDGSQSAWYPILYDIKKDRKYDRVNYDIEINCADCKTLYINGNLPVEGTHANFKSKEAQELTMFLGDYRTIAVNGTYLLNANMTDQQLTMFEETVSGYTHYFENHVQIPYKGNPVYIQTTPVSKYNSWLFASYPTIVNIGFDQHDLKSFGEAKKMVMAHELGHYYFGKYRAFNSEMGDMLMEGFAEFLALHVTRKMAGDSAFRQRMDAKIQSLSSFHPIPFASIRSHDDYQNRELYVYYYAPLIFTAIEKEIGEDAMWKWIHSLLQTPAGFTNYVFIRQTLAGVLKDNTKLAGLENRYFNTDKAVANAVATLGMSTGQQQTNAQPVPDTRKTYYYFLFSAPMVDAGSPDNRTIKHTEIGEVTCTRAELSKISGPLFKQASLACENRGGCSSEFNIYDTLETAKAALQRWLNRYNPDSTSIIKILK